ncbi:MAG: hypothetical protein KDC38_06520 [Planctomycetes bacterium]|nr:hypothetical protein [Planctomycetota bacterium]
MARRWWSALVALCACFPLSAVAVDRFPVWDDDRFAGGIDPPSAYFGVPLGERFTPHHDVLRYCRYVAENSTRAVLQPYGVTPEGRELITLVISSEANLDRLDEIRALQKQLADPRGVEDEAALASLLERLPAVLWMSYNVHGNEASATEAALRTIYHLVDGEDDRTRSIRDGAVVIIDPLLNPDGRERYLGWYHQVGIPGGDANPRSREHDEPWPGGRSNHYYFDLNRDWSWLSQVETRARVARYLDWLPLVHGDFHEMSPESTYFFFPAEEPINLNFTDHTRRWGAAFGRANADAFDRNGWLYYTEESFDLFYPGYGDSWPSLQGAIGMTYEQGGGPSAGLRYRRRDGSILTLAERLHHHVVASLATLECATRRRTELQRSFHEFRRGVTDGDVAEYVFPPTPGPRRSQLLELLRDQGVEIERTARECVADALTDPLGRTHDLLRLPAGTAIVSLAQPCGRLAKSLLEPNAPVTVNRFYDVSAWSLPFSMGVEAFAAPRRIDVDRTAWVADPATVAIDREARYAYLAPWNGVPAARALHALQTEGLRVRLVPEAITIDGREYPHGTLQVPVRQGGDVHAAVRRAAERSGAEFFAVDSGLTESGIDLGSDKVVDLAKPRIAVATGSGVSSSSFGAVWYLFERELEIPFTAFDLESFDRLDLSELDVIIFPSGYGYRRELRADRLETLKSWVRDGGVLIGLGGGGFALTAEETGLTSVSRKFDEDPKKDDEERVRRKIRELRDDRRRQQVPGNIFAVELDPDHPLALGLPETVYVHMEGTDSFALSGDARDVGAFPEDPALSGYISEENEKKIGKRVYLAEESVGRGHVILFADDPNFRLFWRGLTRLFLNAVFLRCEP